MNIPPEPIQLESTALQGADKFRWIMKTGWKGSCPRCGKGRMFQSWLKVSKTCEVCGLDYSFAAPDDGPAFFSLCIVALPLIIFPVWLEAAFDPPFWVHLVTSFPMMGLGCVLPLRPIKGWLIASQYVNKAQEHGTAQLWAQLNAREAERTGQDAPSAPGPGFRNAQDSRRQPQAPGQ